MNLPLRDPPRPQGVPRVPANPAHATVAASPDSAAGPRGGTNPEPFRLGYRPELDRVRAVAVALILAGHAAWFFPWIAHNAQGFMLGVDLFFALSGFLLTSLLIEERDRNRSFSFRGFYERRALRPLPSLYVMLASFVVTMWIVGSDLAVVVRSCVIVVFYGANFALIYDKPGFSLHLQPMWSLAVEEQYYLLFFPALILLLRFVRSVRTVFVVVGSSIVAVALWRLWLSTQPDPNLCCSTPGPMPVSMRCWSDRSRPLSSTGAFDRGSCSRW